MHDAVRRFRELPDHAGELVPATIFLATWIYPGLTRFLDDDIGNTLNMCMWLEFILGHAGTAFAVTLYVGKSRGSRVGMTAFFGVVYAALVVGISLVMGSVYPLIQFGAVFVGRMRQAGGASGSEVKLLSVLATASRVFLLMITMGIAAAIPLPQLGASPEALPLRGDGRMIEHPHMVMAWGVLYFTASWYIYVRGAPKIREKLAGTIDRVSRLTQKR